MPVMGTPEQQAYDLGYRAWKAGLLPSANPWVENPELFRAWRWGWSDAGEHAQDDLTMDGYDRPG